MVPDEEWPEDQAQRNVVVADFDKTTPWGDRRQEIVFIGVGMDEAAICAQLDTALLTPEEMDKYRLQYKCAPDHTNLSLILGPLLHSNQT